MAKSRHKSNRQRSQVGSGGGLQDASFLECPDCGNSIGHHNWKSSRGKKNNARMRSVRTSSRKGSIGQRSYIRRYTRSLSRRRAKRGAKRCAKRGGRRTAQSRSTCATRSRRSALGKLRGRRSKTRGKRGRGKSIRGRSRVSSHARSVCSSSRVSCQRSTARKQQSQSTLSRKGSSTNKRRYVRPCRGVRAKRAGRRTARSQSTQSQSTTPRKGSTNKRRYVRRPANRRGRAKRGVRRTVTRSRSSTSSSSRGRSSTSTAKRAKQSTNRYKRGRGTKYHRGRRQASRTSRKSNSPRPTKAKRSRRPTRLGICTCCHHKIKYTDSTQAQTDPEQESAPDSARLSTSSSELSIREEQPSTTEAPEQQERPSSELSLSEPLTTTNVPTSTPLMVDDDHNNMIPIPETNTAPEVRTIIFRPTIVIVQNVFILPGQLQASSSINQNSLNVVNMLNQEVFIFSNSNELPHNIGAQYGLVNAPSTNQIQTILPASSPVPSSSVALQSSATSDKPVPPQ